MKKQIATFFVSLTIFSTLLVPAAMGEDRSEEYNALTRSLNSENIDARITALKKISNSGLTDKTLFDLIRDRLVEGYETTSATEKKKIDELAWLCKALASSGIPEYREVLNMVGEKAQAKKVRGYAIQSVGQMESYAQRNNLLKEQTLETEGLSPEDRRLVNLLRAQDVKLKRDAAKTITRSISTNSKVFEVANEELLALLPRENLTRNDIDTMGWLCKALGASGDARYKGTLEGVINSREKKEDQLLKHATQSLEMLK